MANIENKYPKNVQGKFFVDNQCIDCDICTEEAPDHFKRNDDEGYYFVCKQPATSQEEKLCRAAMEMCPVDAIGVIS